MTRDDAVRIVLLDEAVSRDDIRRTARPGGVAGRAAGQRTEAKVGGDAMNDIYINEDGTMQHVYSDELAGLLQGQGETVTRRASHVEPYGDGWMADMRPVGGPVLLAQSVLDGSVEGKPFATRAEALAAEVAWLEANMTERKITFNEGAR